MPAPKRGPTRLDDRDHAIWEAYVSGATQIAIAADFQISRQRVSQIIVKVRETLPEADRAHLVQREAALLDRLRREALKLWDMPPIPAHSHGKIILMEDGTPAEDHSGRLAALDRAVKLHERLSKLLGLEAPAKADVSLVGQEREATSEAAAAALAYLQDADGEDADGEGVEG